MDLFSEFVDGIERDQRILVFSHDDLDGLASAVFLYKILEKKGLSANFFFCSYQEVYERIFANALKGDKIFILDMAVDSFDEGLFERLKEFDFLLVDHHPGDVGKRIIRFESRDCVAFGLFKMGDFEKDDWMKRLLVATMFSEFSLEKKENLEFVEDLFEDVSFGKDLSLKLNYASIYYEKNLNDFFEVLKRGNLREVERVYGVVREEIEKHRKIIEGNLREGLNVYILESDFGIVSALSTLVSVSNPEKVFFVLKEKGGFFKGSLRSNRDDLDLNEIFRSVGRVFEEFKGGGHKHAAGCYFPKEIFEEVVKLISEAV